jgi:hypothetical protein
LRYITKHDEHKKKEVVSKRDNNVKKDYKFLNVVEKKSNEIM